MLTTTGKNVKKGASVEKTFFGCSNFFEAVHTEAFLRAKNEAYNKVKLAIHLSSPLIVLTNLYI